MSTERRHDLVIGGSGMLAGLCLDLATAGRRVSVIGRDVPKLHRLAKLAPDGAIRPISLDYRDADILRAALKAAVEEAGPIERAVCWVHGESTENTPLVIAEFVARHFCHVQGSAAADPARPDLLSDWQKRFSTQRPGLAYQIVILGFIEQARLTSRWLSHDEISDGVKRALESREPVAVVGRVHPWSARP